MENWGTVTLVDDTLTGAGATGDDGAEAPARPVAGEPDGRIGWFHRVPPRMWLAATLVVAFVVRVVNINGNGFNSDEAVYAGQAASLAGNPLFTQQFPVFRAHPLLLPVLLSPLFGSGTPDVVARLVVVAMGVATVFGVYLIGRELFGWRTGVLGALVLALMPYHVGVTRQLLLDGPATLCITFAFWMFARFVRTRSWAWLAASAATLGLGVLTKETSIVVAGAMVVFIVLAPAVRRPLRTSAVFLGVTVAVSLTFPVVMSLAGRKSTGQSYLAWQLTRTSTHAAGFYFTAVPAAIGWLVVAVALAGLLFRANWNWRVALLVCWVAVPVLFFEFYPLKGFQYLLPVAPAMALLAARSLLTWHLPARLRMGDGRAARPVVVGVVLASMLVGTWATVFPTTSNAVLAGGGGIAGGREAGRWIDEHLVPGTELLTIGPSMGNILAYYGHRPAQGLSVSADPLHRNPSYWPVYNADLSIHQGQFSYLVWDAYSAYRSPTTAKRLQVLVATHHGIPVHEVRIGGKPIIVIYEVHP